MNTAQRIGFFGGPLVFAAILLYPVLFGLPADMTSEMISVLAVISLMAIWWVTEAIPIPATALLPIALFPLLGVMKSADSTIPYANHLIYLFIGGFFLAVTMEKWNLHKRIALHTIRVIGTGPNRVILGFMLATGFLSMWVSNTATAMMMVPVGMAVITQVVNVLHDEGVKLNSDKFNFGTALMLGIAYAASIGGVGTIIGTPPNTVLVGVIEQQYGQTISFAQWMAFGVPLSVTFLFLTWFLLTKVMLPPVIDRIPGCKELINREIAKLGPISKEEIMVLVIFGIVAAAWIVRGFMTTPFVSDTTIAMIGAVSLFIIPSNFNEGKFLLDWQTAVKIPWGVVLLFGGGLALTGGVSSSGLDVWLTGQFTLLNGLTLVVIILIVTTAAIFLTEVTSNTATATLLVPVMGTVAIAMSLNPLGPMIAAGVATSYAFMLPVATPPNAVVFGSGQVTIAQMAKVGLWLNLAGIALITLFVMVFLQLIWGIDLNTLPAWATLATN